MRMELLRMMQFMRVVGVAVVVAVSQSNTRSSLVGSGALRSQALSSVLPNHFAFIW